MKPWIAILHFFSFSLTFAVRGFAADGPVMTDPDLPQSFDPSALTSLVHQSPFNRVVSFEDTYLLTGIAYVEGKPLATLMNRETKQRFVVSDEPNAQGWRLAEASTTTDVHEAAVKLYYGEEEVYLHYTDVLKMPDRKLSSRSGKREVTPVDIHKLAESDYLRKDENGKTYIRGSIYLPTEDRDHYYNGMSTVARDRFREVIRDNRDKMFSFTPDQRAAYTKQVFDQAEAEERAGKLK
jgi:hypothetical protein